MKVTIIIEVPDREALGEIAGFIAEQKGCKFIASMIVNE